MTFGTYTLAPTNVGGQGFQLPQTFSAADLNFGNLVSPSASSTGLAAPSSFARTPLSAVDNPLIGSAGNTGNQGLGLGMNMPTLQLGMGALNSFANLWQSWNASKLAKEQFKFAKEFANTNLNNQIQSYNTALSDRAGSRAVMEGRSPESAQAYVQANAMRR